LIWGGDWGISEGSVKNDRKSHHQTAGVLRSWFRALLVQGVGLLTFSNLRLESLVALLLLLQLLVKRLESLPSLLFLCSLQPFDFSLLLLGSRPN
jgi:hypothetical protein